MFLTCMYDEVSFDTLCHVYFAAGHDVLLVLSHSFLKCHATPSGWMTRQWGEVPAGCGTDVKSSLRQQFVFIL